jgi:hypothetical protein
MPNGTYIYSIKIAPYVDEAGVSVCHSVCDANGSEGQCTVGDIQNLKKALAVRCCLWRDGEPGMLQSPEVVGS